MPSPLLLDARPRRRSPGALIVALALVATIAVAGPVPAAPSARVVTGFTAAGSINQVSTSGHRPAEVVHLLAPDGEVIGTGRADAHGAYLFKGVAEGEG